MGTRVKEHRLDINKQNNNKSVISEHRLNFNHNFKWDEAEILDKETFLSKRLISEMIFIKRQTNSLNLQTDTECLPDSYSNIIESLPKL